MKIFVIMAALLMSTNAFAAIVTWDDQGADAIWDTVDNWDNNFAPSAANDYVVDGFTIQNPDNGGTAAEATETFGGKSLAVKNGTIILYRNVSGSSGRSQVNIIPKFSLIDSIMDVRAGYASSKVTLNSPVTLAGDNTIILDAVRCSYTFQLVMPQPIIGNGTLTVYRTDKGSGRQFYVNGENADYYGNWDVYSTVNETLDIHFYKAPGWGNGKLNLGHYAKGHLRVNVNSGSITMDSTAILDLHDKVSSVGGLTFDGTEVAPGTYTAAELNTATASTAFAGTGTLTVNSTAWNPEPADTAANVAVDAQVSWSTARDLDVSEHQLYIGAANDPNLIDVVPVIINDNGTGRISHNPGTLSRDAVYTWRVDQKLADDSIVRGNVWSFETVSSVPAIITEPASMYVWPDGLAELTVEALNPFTMDATGLNYQWYQDGQPIVNSNAATYSVAQAQASDQGQYYCTVTIISNNAKIDSSVATLTVKRQIADWAFEENLTDSIAGLEGNTDDPNSNPEFVDGYAGRALSLDGVGDFVDLPIEVFDSITGEQISLVMWLNSGPKEKTTAFGAYAASGARVVSAHIPWANTIYFDAGNSGGYDRISKGKPLAELQDVWTHYVFTKNTLTGEMKIYLNGKLWLSGTGKYSQIRDAANFWIGKAYDANQNWQGIIDELKIYNYEVDADAVAGIYYEYTGEKTCLYSPEWDLTGPEGVADCVVNLYDFATFANSWLENGLRPE
ncbi:MAG: hypothetical protein JEZ07_19935 [Phycisphaerae bacterium]|nr:hypothetical protein [Phycisphaerae bacterium]